MSDSWDFYFSNVNDKLASLFVDLGIHDSAPDAARPWLLWLWVEFNHPREDGLSSREEYETLCAIEDSLTTSIHRSMPAVVVGRITTDGRREFYFYSSESTRFADAVAAAMAEFPDYRWELGSKLDPKWTHYFNVLYPTPHDWQRIKNQRVIEQLQTHGDILEKPRDVSHWAYFSSESERSEFVSRIKAQRFSVIAERKLDDETSGSPWAVVFERRDAVDGNSINEVTILLADLADEFGGDYDGWETPIITE